MKTLPLDQKVRGSAYLKRLVAEPLTAGSGADPAVILALGDRLKVFSAFLKLGRYFFTPVLTHDADAVRSASQGGRPALLEQLNEVLAASILTMPRWSGRSTITPVARARWAGCQSASSRHDGARSGSRPIAWRSSGVTRAVSGSPRPLDTESAPVHETSVSIPG